jgi:hypothetical protein
MFPVPNKNDKTKIIRALTLIQIRLLKSEKRKRVWIDVGAHLGEDTFEEALVDPNLLVYALSPI